MKAAEVLPYTQLYEKIWGGDGDDHEQMEKLLLDEVGARMAWQVISCLDQFKGFDQGFWGGIPDDCKDNIFNELANLFRDEPYQTD